MAPSIQLLLGPPEIHLSSTTTTTSDPFMDLMVSKFNTTKLTTKPPMALTENQSPTFLSTGNPCLDFFFHVVPDTPPESLAHWLDLAWKHNPLTTLKLICNLRGVRGTGKSDKEGFYTAAVWLHRNHPKTLASNVKCFASFGYFKDLPEILYRLIEGVEVRKFAKEEREQNRTYKGIVRIRPKKDEDVKKSTIPRELRIQAELERIELVKEKAKIVRNKKIISLAKIAVEIYAEDPNYRFLHDVISEVFAHQLISDIMFLKSGDFFKISLASKWCPSLDSSFDRSTLLCQSIAKRVYPRNSYPEYQGIDEAHYVYRVRGRLRKEVLVRLRQVLQLPETYMSSNQWNSLPYNRVPSVAMKTYKKLFRKHDETRFKEYLDNVKHGKAKIAAGALLPHEILESAGDKDGGEEVAELQWRRMMEDLSHKGKLKNCLAICDVSGSMEGKPMLVCIALGLLISEMSEAPWKGKMITFSECPQLHMIQGEDLRSKTNFIKQMAWGMNTDFQKVFDLILKVANDGKLSGDKMIKRLFVFSDMEFDQASANDWETDYEVIQRKFRENGYVSVPEMVFWNLRDSKATPVASNQKGVALVSGFSKNLLKLFLEGGGTVNPEDAMELAISGAEYKKLVVVD